jgi:hypothetical protein
MGRGCTCPGLLSESRDAGGERVVLGGVRDGGGGGTPGHPTRHSACLCVSASRP